MQLSGNEDLIKIARYYIDTEPRFEPIKNQSFEILWNNPRSFEKAFQAWGLSWSDGTTNKIRMNELLIELDAPEIVTISIVAHELIHFLPGCTPHNETFWDHEINIMGENYYEATIWLRQHSGQFDRCYKYRDRSWLQLMINRDQLRIKDIAEICGCSQSTIKRWLKKYDLQFLIN
jgi:hypothetical protein